MLYIKRTVQGNKCT